MSTVGRHCWVVHLNWISEIRHQAHCCGKEVNRLLPSQVATDLLTRIATEKMKYRIYFKKGLVLDVASGALVYVCIGFNV